MALPLKRREWGFLPEGLQLLPVLGSPFRSSLRIKQREKGERLGCGAGRWSERGGAVLAARPAAGPAFPLRRRGKSGACSRPRGSRGLA